MGYRKSTGGRQASSRRKRARRTADEEGDEAVSPFLRNVERRTMAEHEERLTTVVLAEARAESEIIRHVLAYPSTAPRNLRSLGKP